MIGEGPLFQMQIPVPQQGTAGNQGIITGL